MNLVVCKAWHLDAGLRVSWGGFGDRRTFDLRDFRGQPRVIPAAYSERPQRLTFTVEGPDAQAAMRTIARVMVEGPVPTSATQSAAELGNLAMEEGA